jgi:hypothetical protein
MALRKKAKQVKVGEELEQLLNGLNIRPVGDQQEKDLHRIKQIIEDLK